MLKFFVLDSIIEKINGARRVTSEDLEKKLAEEQKKAEEKIRKRENGRIVTEKRRNLWARLRGK